MAELPSGVGFAEERQQSMKAHLCRMPHKSLNHEVCHPIPSSRVYVQSSCISCLTKKTPTYRFLKGPPLTDFVFVVVKHLLVNLNDSVPHVLYLSDQLKHKFEDVTQADTTSAL